MSGLLTTQQREDYERHCLNTQRQDVGMAKWELKFNDGKGAIMLTDQARNPAEAFLAAAEKFGANFKEIA